MCFRGLVILFLCFGILVQRVEELDVSGDWMVDISHYSLSDNYIFCIYYHSSIESCTRMLY